MRRTCLCSARWPRRLVLGEVSVTSAPQLRSDIGIPSYDQAIWSDWVPEIVGCVADPKGMSTFYQDVPKGIIRRNECQVDGSENTCLLIWDRGCSRISETRFAGKALPIELLAGQGVLIPANTDSKWVSNYDTFSGIMHLHFTPVLMGRIAEDLRGGFNLLTAPLVTRFEDAAVTASIRWLFRETRDAKPSTLMWDTASTFLALQLVRSLDRGALIRTPVRGGLAAWQLRRVTDYLAAKFADDVTLKELAGLTGLSVFHFARAFKQATGVPPHVRLVELRVEQARRLLETTKRTVTDIALEVGYENSQSLARVFARKVGMTPSAYRRDRGL